MKAKIISYLLPLLVDSLLTQFDEKTVKDYLDSLIDSLENRIQQSPSEIDDALLPIVHTVRVLFDVPDNDK